MLSPDAVRLGGLFVDNAGKLEHGTCENIFPDPVRKGDKEGPDLAYEPVTDERNWEDPDSGLQGEPGEAHGETAEAGVCSPRARIAPLVTSRSTSASRAAIVLDEDAISAADEEAAAVLESVEANFRELEREAAAARAARDAECQRKCAEAIALYENCTGLKYQESEEEHW